MKTIVQNIKQLDKASFIRLKDMCYESRCLYNSGLYIVRQYFFETNKYIGYNELYHEIKDNIYYKNLPAKISQQILRLIDKNFRSFFALLKRKRAGKYQDKINIPKYKKGDYFILILPNDQVSVKNNKLKITKDLKLDFKYEIKGEIKQLIIKWTGVNFRFYLSYNEIKENKNYGLNKDNKLSIDLGINNLCACFSTIGHSFLIKGKVLKSYNQYYNKRKASIKSELKKVNDKNWSKSLSIIENKRYDYINNYFNQVVSYIIKHCLEYKIGIIVIGYNEVWKQDINIGKVNNQKFVNIPYWLLKRKLESKCNDYDIEFILQEESYTSKCSFLDKEKIEKHTDYIGKRIKRGLFRTGNGKLINADINGAANILQKVFSNDNLLSDEIGASIVMPLVVSFILGAKKYIK